MRALICGGRDYNPVAVQRWLDHAAPAELGEPITEVIHGAASGADTGAAIWARGEGVRALAYPANWKKFGKRAGPLRNRRMLEEGKPDVVIAFPGGRGTADMIRQAQEVGVRILEAK